MRHPPAWWSWPLELSPHLLRRMLDRGFTESDLREMLEDARAVRPDAAPGRYLIETRFGGRRWEVIMEPDEAAKVVIVVTAYVRKSRKIG